MVDPYFDYEGWTSPLQEPGKIHVSLEKLNLHTKPCPKAEIFQPHTNHTYLSVDSQMTLVYCPGHVLKRRFR